VRRLARAPNRSYETYRRYIEQGTAEVAANTVLCLTNQASYLLRQSATAGLPSRGHGWASQPWHFHSRNAS
jgi:hypothetical protein